MHQHWLYSQNMFAYRATAKIPRYAKSTDLQENDTETTVKLLSPQNTNFNTFSLDEHRDSLLNIVVEKKKVQKRALNNLKTVKSAINRGTHAMHDGTLRVMKRYHENSGIFIFFLWTGKMGFTALRLGFNHWERESHFPK